MIPTTCPLLFNAVGFSAMKPGGMGIGVSVPETPCGVLGVQRKP